MFTVHSHCIFSLRQLDRCTFGIYTDAKQKSAHSFNQSSRFLQRDRAAATQLYYIYNKYTFILFSLFGNLPYCIIVDDGEDDDRCHGQIAGSQNNIYPFSLSRSSLRSHSHPFSHLMCTYVTIASHTCEVRSVTRQKNFHFYFSPSLSP